MSHKLAYKENTAYLVMVAGATFADGDSNMPKCANAHSLAKKMLGLSDKVVFAHVLYGPDDLLVMVKGDTTTEASELVRQIRDLSRDTPWFLIATCRPSADS